MGGIPNAPGPSPTLGSLGPSHQWHHKSRASLRGPPCAHGVAGTPQGEVRDTGPPIRNLETALIHADGHAIPVLFLVGADGFCWVRALCLSLRFQFRKESMHIEEYVFDAVTGNLTHTVSQFSVVKDDDKLWLLKPRTYRAYGLSDSLPPCSTELLTPRVSSTSTLLLPTRPMIKVEPGLPEITLLSDDLEDDLPSQVPSTKTQDPSPCQRSFLSPISNSCQESGPSYSKPPLPQKRNDGVSIIDCLKRLCSRRGSKSALSKLDFNNIKTEKVEFLPPCFDSDVIFELPPIGNSATLSQARLLRGMDRCHDGHAWTRTITSNIKNDMGLTFRTSSYSGHLRCSNADCEYITRVHRTLVANEIEWDGVSSFTFEVGMHPLKGSTLVCNICKSPPSYLAICPAKIYYVLGKDYMTRACVNLGSHRHPMKVGIYRDAMERTRSLLRDQVERTPMATNSSIVLEASKELIGELLLRPEGAPQKSLEFHKLIPMLDQCKHMSSPSIRNQVTTFRYMRQFGVMDNITKLQGSSNWAFCTGEQVPRPRIGH